MLLTVLQMFVCFLLYKSLICWLSLYLIGADYDFLLCLLFPLTLIWLRLDVNCFALHILLHQIAALDFGNSRFTYLRLLIKLFCPNVLCLYKGKGKGHPITRHEGPEGDV